MNRKLKITKKTVKKNENYGINEIKINNFRGFDEIEIKNFKKINIFVGKNSSGKTSILEAIFLSLKPYGLALIDLYGLRKLPLIPISTNNNLQMITTQWSNMSHFFNSNIGNKENCLIRTKSNFSCLNLERTVIIKPYYFSRDKIAFEKDAFDFLQNVENQKENSDFIYIISKDKTKDEEIIFSTGIEKLNNPALPDCADTSQINFRDIQAKNYKDSKINYPKFKIFFHGTENTGDNILSQRFERIRDSEYGVKILKLMKKIVSTIEEFRLNSRGLIEVVHKNNNEKYVLPFALLGEGAQKIFSVLCSISYCKDGVLLIDEVENGLHYSSQEIFWDLAIEAAQEFNVQIFTTTHSYEMIEALERVSEKRNFKSLSINRIYKNSIGFGISSYDAEELDKFLDEKWEIR